MLLSKIWTDLDLVVRLEPPLELEKLEDSKHRNPKSNLWQLKVLQEGREEEVNRRKTRN